MKRAVIYARCSTKEQDPGMQLADLRQYAQNRQYEVVEEFVENGVSGTIVSRPKLNELMDKARKRLFDVVLVWKFDRFARSVKHLLSALEEFKGLGIDFISYTENIDTSGPMGKAMFTIMGAIAELERALIVERVNGGIKRARANGKKLGRPETEMDEDKLIELRNQGMSIRKLSQVFHVTRSTIHNRIKTLSKNPCQISA